MAVGTGPQRVIAIGGGTGLPVVLRGLRLLVRSGETTSVTALVTMTDDGGSSGRLRRSMGLPPPGDVRNCLVALAEEESLLGALFQHRYGSSEFEGHSVGNLILAALAERTGSFLKAVEMSSRVLRTVGRILPATEDDVRLRATLEDGSQVVGETKVAAVGGRIHRISLIPDDAAPAPGVIDALLEADLVVLGPGSLYTSILPNLAVRGIAEALRRTEAAIVWVANLVSEPGAAALLDLEQHLRVMEDHAGGPVIDAVLVHDGPVEDEVLRRYELEGCTPLYWTGRPAERLHVERRSLLAVGPKLRHDPAATAEGLIAAWTAVDRSGARRAS